MISAHITGGFWRYWLDTNARHAIYHQWEQLEASGCIDNFRILAEKKDVWREGWFFADSDAYKWLDAAARVYAEQPDPALAAIMDDFIALLKKAQAPDGYLFTYNQIHFPGIRWVNLQIEHELYCHGHLIEAGVSHFTATAKSDLLEIARLAADRIVSDFSRKSAIYTPGHEEIEIALLRLYRITGHRPYLDLAQQFIQKRGRSVCFALSTLKQYISVARRDKFVQKRKRQYLDAHPGQVPCKLPPGNFSKKPANATLRWFLSALSGKYAQQHIEVSKQKVPVGHSVRFAYLETAVAMLAQVTGDTRWIENLECTWDRMVRRRMYVTGGVGALPSLEGFGRDYELDPEYAYAETCAALGSIFWNWEMALLTDKAKYSDLLEWQLYNAALVGFGLDGRSYLYNNPLACRGGVTRRPWYAVPCCPSNLSRTWAILGNYIVSRKDQELWIHQYISSISRLDAASGEAGLTVEMQSGLPWEGRASLKLAPADSASYKLHLRHPSWSARTLVSINGEQFQEINSSMISSNMAFGYDPYQSSWITIERSWSAGDVVELVFELPIQLRRAHPKVKGHKGKVALTRSPLVYCLESIDNPGLNLFDLRLDPSTIHAVFDETLLNGIWVLHAQTTDEKSLTFIPYHLWANRGESQMTVWVNL
ncbi:MAG: beta-L-arabinofuranosidase domain-containing protein [Chloroflexota bacterium]